MEILRINDTAVLNFYDLHSKFSPRPIYDQLEAFDHFAAVHCVPLPLQLTDTRSGKKYVASCLTKEFWHGILHDTQWPEDAASPEDCLKAFLHRQVEACGDDGGACQTQADKEAADAGLMEKLEFITHSAGTGQDVRKAVLLLAICELAEVDPRKTDASSWKSPSSAEAGPHKKKSEPSFFPHDQTAYLTPGNHPYQYWCYDDETLASGVRIQTVRIEAVESGNQYAQVKVELYSQRSNQCLCRFYLKSGEFRYCTVAQGRIIRLLPGVSLSDDLCLSRPNYAASEIKVCPRDGEAWTLKADRVSFFCTGSRKQGFLLIQNGKVNSKFYQGAEDYLTRIQLEMVALPVVEARVAEDGYELLLENGTTLTNTPGGPRTGVLSLSPPDWQLPAVTGLSELREAALSATGKSLAVLYGEGGEKVFFAGGDRTVQIREENGGTVIAVF